MIKPDEVPDFAGLIYAYEGSVQCYSLEKGRYAVKRIFFDVVKPAQKVSDMKADDNFIRKLDLSMYYRYHQMRRDNYKIRNNMELRLDPEIPVTRVVNGHNVFNKGYHHGLRGKPMKNTMAKRELLK